jgi:RNA polymerase sigma factor (sigma-70 family)
MRCWVSWRKSPQSGVIVFTVTPDELTEYRPWLYKQAHALLSPGDPEVEDLVQEGYISMWKALGTYKPDSGSLPSWLTSKARFRMIEVVQRKNWSGQPSRQHGRNPATSPKLLSLDASTGDGITLADILPGNDTMESVMEAYHHGEIYDAISSLTPAQREYVYARFWNGLTTAEMKAEIFGYDPSALWNSQRNGARMKLAEKLSRIGGLWNTSLQRSW